MFTGIVKLLGKIKSIEALTDGIAVSIECATADLNIEIGDSISVNGVCSTVVEFNETSFLVHYLQETLRVTTFDSLEVGNCVNLEPSITMQTKLSGHYVSGHVDGIAQISAIERSDPWGKLTITFDYSLNSYFIYKGSIAIDGVSLTIAELSETSLTCHIIPHTFEETILKYYDVGNNVNIECDMIGKYVIKTVQQGSMGLRND